MKKGISLTKTEESIFTLMSLFVLINQAFETLVGQEDILYSEFDKGKDSFYHLVTDTIHEALVYQILLKTVAYLDEWNDIFGVRTDDNTKQKIKLLKKIAKPAYSQISSWKHLRDFRNEAIAHNHRDKKGNNIYISAKSYHYPEGPGELYLMIYCLMRMTDLVKFFFQQEIPKIISTQRDESVNKSQRLSQMEIQTIIHGIDYQISEQLQNLGNKQ